MYFIIHLVELEVDCEWGSWGEWTACSADCGGGRKSRSRPVATPASDGGKPCEGNSTQWENCNMQTCGFDCVWGLWGEWSTCSKTCGGGRKSRSRKVAMPATRGGETCKGPGVIWESCNTQTCSNVTKSGSTFFWKNNNLNSSKRLKILNASNIEFTNCL